MGTTAEKLTYLNTTKQNLKTVINTTGAGLTDESTFRSYANVLNDKILGAINGNVDLFEEYPKVSGNGTDLSLNGVVEGKMSITPQGVSSQESTTGSNIIGLDNEQYHVNLRAGDKIVVINETDSTVTIDLFTNYGDATRNDYWTITTAQSPRVITIANDSLAIKWHSVPNGKAWVNLGETVLPYEPYTGRIPAPNPDFPEEVKNVTGNNVLNLYNKNLIEIEEGDISSTTGENTTNANSMRSKNFIQYKENTMYYPSVNSQKPSNVFNIRAYNSNKEYIGHGTLGINGFQNFAITIVTSVSDTNVAYFKVRFAKSVATSTDSVMISTSSDLSYVEHEEQNYTLSLGNIELNSTPDGTMRDGIYGSSDVSYNLFDKNNANLVQKGIISSQGILTDDNDTRLENENLIFLTPGTYTISNTICDNVWVWAYDENKTYQFQKIMTTWATGYSYTFTISENLYIRFIWRKSDNSVLSLDDDYKILLTEGSEVKPYAPYGQVGMWYKREYIGKVVLNGSESWENRPSYQYADRFVLGTVMRDLTQNDMLINNFKYGNANSNTYPYLAKSGGQCVINFSEFGSTTLEQFKEWLTTHNTIVYGTRVTPTDIPITDQILISQLNDIYNNAHSYNGTTNIATTYEDGNEQMYLDVEALKNVWEVTE